MAEQGLDRELATLLLAWYRVSARRLPWRAAPGGRPDPYRVWLSEIMLQQTTVAAVKGYYAEFLERWPTVGDLAAAPLDDVLKAWAGLGYYARARNLHACARAVMWRYCGRFPDGEEALLALPGIGPYTAAAIAAIAFGRRAAAVDGNAERVISRLYAIDAPLASARAEIRRRTLALVPDEAPGDFAQALMDLGATICTPRKPNCLICPWMRYCLARRQGIAELLPRKQLKPALPTRVGIAFWIERDDGCILLRRRPDTGLLGGMMEIPSTPWTAELPANPAAHAPTEARWIDTGLRIDHTFTHFRLELHIWKAKHGAPPSLDGRWLRRDELPGEALPTVMRKIVEAMT